MAFEDVAKRMKNARRLTRRERIQQLWTGEAPEPPPLPERVAPARRTGRIILAYVVLLLGLVVAMAGGIALMLFWSSISGWELRGLVVVIAIGFALVVKSTMLFDTVEGTAPLPDARLRR